MDIVERAKMFAIGAHNAIKQKRKYTGEQYWVHTNEVAQILDRTEGATFEMIAAAHLHDTVEDTGVTIEDIRYHFGEEVAELVGWLTDVSKPEDGNRAARKAIDRAHSGASSAAAQTIKVADLISNSRTIVEHDVDFAKVYLKEKRQLLDVLTKADTSLRAMAYRILEESEIAIAHK